MGTSLESAAAFKKRAREVGISQAAIDALAASGVSSYGAYAFITPYQPGQADETPLVEALARVLTRDPTAAEMIGFRRLFFEAITLSVSEIQQRQQRDDTAEPTRMPLAERNARLEEQKGRLVGVFFSPETEPSHKLVDTISQMSIDQTLEWTPWEKLTSRASEITHSQKDLKISLDASGGLKLTNKASSPDACVTGELAVRQALGRRSRAFDIAQLCSYTRMESWHERLFEHLMREPAPNALPVTLHQVREADKALFRKLAELTRGDLSQHADNTRPMETHLTACMDHPEVQFCLLPMVKPSTVASIVSQSVHKPEATKKEKDKDKVKKITKDKDPPAPLPAGCNQMTPQGKPICNSFNRGRCKFAKEGKRCKYGFHVCWKCFKPRPYQSCECSKA